MILGFWGSSGPMDNDGICISIAGRLTDILMSLIFVTLFFNPRKA